MGCEIIISSSKLTNANQQLKLAALLVQYTTSPDYIILKSTYKWHKHIKDNQIFEWACIEVSCEWAIYKQAYIYKQLISIEKTLEAFYYL